MLFGEPSASLVELDRKRRLEPPWPAADRANQRGLKTDLELAPQTPRQRVPVGRSMNWARSLSNCTGLHVAGSE